MHVKGMAAGLVIAVVLLSGCGGSGDEAAGDRPVIGVSLLTLSNPFFVELGEALRDEADQRGYDVIITAADLDVGRQRNQVSDFIVQRVAAIVLCPADSRAIGTSIAEANRAGVPVFTADIATTAEGVDVVTHVATDNYQAGRMAAKAVLEAINGSGEVGIIDYPEVESVILRTRGFQDELSDHMEETGNRIDIVSRLPGSGTTDRSYRAAEDMVQAHDELAAIFAINDPSALGAIAALERAGKLDQVSVIGVDGMPEAKQAIKEGRIYATAIQFPEEIGRRTVEMIDLYMRGEEVPGELLIPTDLYRQEDALADGALR